MEIIADLKHVRGNQLIIDKLDYKTTTIANEVVFLIPKHNLRSTRQRRIILEELRRINNHPSADELYERIRKIMPRISLGTVYRNLEILHEIGEIQKIELGGTLKRFDGNPEKHYHVRCINCDRLDDAPVCFQKNIEQGIDAMTGYKIVGHRLEFLGLCPNCLDKAVERPISGFSNLSKPQ